MKNLSCFLIFCLIVNSSFVDIYAQNNKHSTDAPNNITGLNKILYSSLPNHIELVAKTLELAFVSGFVEVGTNIY
jgi:hypothetical protein